MRQIAGCAGIALLVAGCNGTARRTDPPAQRATPAPVQAELQETPGIPTRSLLAAIDDAKFGAAAQVHAPAAGGSGLVLPAQHEVLAHLRAVMGSDHQIASPIFVDLSLSPEQPRRHVQAYAVAQDPTHDLVLLREGTLPPAGGAAARHDRRPWRHRRYRARFGSGASEDRSSQGDSDEPAQQP